jgi:hypothetical protein
MSDSFRALIERTRAWSKQAHAAGWLDDADVARLAAVEHATPAELFTDPQTRPLVVAFFGGTGVGKSSLLNRLAGQEIARTGVERPTSHEVTLYVHQSVKLADLPRDLPLDTVHVQRHQSDAHREVLWIDVPDIDSTEEANRRSALAWLPHVDLICYVVSPERYRDDVGWRVLQQRGYKHGWLFVLNRWDEGDPRQREDLQRMLGSAGFAGPLVLVTCCRPGPPLPTPDEFTQLQTTLKELLTAHAVRELTRLGQRARLLELRSAVQAAQARLGDEEAWTKLAGAAGQHWQATCETICTGAEWSLRSAAARCAGAKDASLDELLCALWDEWAQSKLVAHLDATEVACRHAGVSTGPCRRPLDDVVAKAGAAVAQCLRDHVRTALARPGTPLVRIARRGTGFLMAFLPLMSLLWVAWAVVVGYYRATTGGASFRGVDLAVHSVLLVLVAWAVPFAADRLLRPSIERTVLQALRSGLRAGLDELGKTLARALDDSAAQARQHRVECDKLLAELAATVGKPAAARAPVLARVVLELPAS